MNIQKIREEIRRKEGRLLKFKFNGARNQIEEFTGKISRIYPSIFTIELTELNKNVKSFSYSDILTNSLQIMETDIEL